MSKSRQVVEMSVDKKSLRPVFQKVKDLFTKDERQELARIITKIMKRKPLEEEEQYKINNFVDTLMTAGILFPGGLPVMGLLKLITFVTPIETKYSLGFLKKYITEKLASRKESIKMPEQKLSRKDIKTIMTEFVNYFKK